MPPKRAKRKALAEPSAQLRRSKRIKNQNSDDHRILTAGELYRETNARGLAAPNRRAAPRRRVGIVAQASAPRGKAKAVPAAGKAKEQSKGKGKAKLAETKGKGKGRVESSESDTAAVANADSAQAAAADDDDSPLFVRNGPYTVPNNSPEDLDGFSRTPVRRGGSSLLRGTSSRLGRYSRPDTKKTSELGQSEQNFLGQTGPSSHGPNQQGFLQEVPIGIVQQRLIQQRLNQQNLPGAPGMGMFGTGALGFPGQMGPNNFPGYTGPGYVGPNFPGNFVQNNSTSGSDCFRAAQAKELQHHMLNNYLGAAGPSFPNSGLNFPDSGPRVPDWGPKFSNGRSNFPHPGRVVWIQGKPHIPLDTQPPTPAHRTQAIDSGHPAVPVSTLSDRPASIPPATPNIVPQEATFPTSLSVPETKAPPAQMTLSNDTPSLGAQDTPAPVSDFAPEELLAPNPSPASSSAPGTEFEVVPHRHQVGAETAVTPPPAVELEDRGIEVEPEPVESTAPVIEREDGEAETTRASSSSSTLASIPEDVEPEDVKLEDAEPENTDPETIEPETIEPETIEPETIEPETIEPDHVYLEHVSQEDIVPEDADTEKTKQPEPRKFTGVIETTVAFYADDGGEIRGGEIKETLVAETQGSVEEEERQHEAPTPNPFSVSDGGFSREDVEAEEKQDETWELFESEEKQVETSEFLESEDKETQVPKATVKDEGDEQAGF